MTGPNDSLLFYSRDDINACSKVTLYWDKAKGGVGRTCGSYGWGTDYDARADASNNPPFDVKAYMKGYQQYEYFIVRLRGNVSDDFKYYLEAY